MEDVPVLLFHNNYENYLKINCEITSANNKVIFLGDSSCQKLDKIPDVDFYDYRDFINTEKMKYYQNQYGK